MVKIGTVTLISLSGVGLRSMQSHIRTFSYGNMNGVQSFKTLQIQIVVHVCSTPRRWKRSHS